MSGREDACPVFQANAYYFRLEIIGQAQLIRNGGGEHYRWRVLDNPFGRATYCFIPFIRCYITVLAPFRIPPVIADNTVDGRCCAGVNGSMAGRSIGWSKVVFGIFTGKAL